MPIINDIRSILVRNIAQKQKTKIQVLIFSKKKFTRKQAVKWAKDHDFKSSDVRETGSSFRLRQIDPKKFKKGSFRTIEIDTGIKAVIGIPN